MDLGVYLSQLFSLDSKGIILFLLAVVVYYTSVLLYALRWKLVLKYMGKEVPLKDLFYAITSAVFINNITPTSRSGGEVLRIAWLRTRYGIPTVLSVASILYERLIEAFPILILMFIGMLYVVRYPIHILLGLVVVVLLAWWKWEKIVEVAARLGRTKPTEEEIRDVMSLKRNAFLTSVVFLLSSLVWVLDVIRLKLITLALGLHLSYIFLALVSVANFLFGMIGITPGGIGIVEGGLIGTLIFLGLPAETALSITILERLISYVISSIIGFITLVSTGGMALWRSLRSR